MEVKIRKAVLALVKGDITQEETDAIVNAANSRLAGGGGVDGAIHRAGGPSIMEECRKIGGCPTGSAVITGAGNLKAKYVIHAVGPIYQGGTRGEERLLRGAYEESLKLATKKGLKSISFPAISAGAYGYPLDEAAKVALQAVIDYLKSTEGIETVRFVLFDDRTLEAFRRQLNALKPYLD
jgi:O-acetyl-ADP-ribose deacetylase (regulator of RNase III)